MKKLPTFEEYLTERIKNKEYEFGCSMLFFDFNEVKSLHNKIEEADIYTEDGFGLETESHITLLYGIHSDEVSDSDVIKKSKSEDLGYLILSNASLFENDKYDVLKFDVQYPSKSEKVLHKINERLKELPHTSTFPEYHPHCTIAYLKPGRGKKYVDMLKGVEFTINPNKLVYSKPDGTKISEDI